MLAVLILGLALLPVPRVRPALPEHNPSDFLRYGCDIRETTDGARWPLWVYVDIRELAPDKNADSECGRQHSWCDLHSVYDSRKKAMEDCSSWMDSVKTVLRKAQPHAKPSKR